MTVAQQLGSQIRSARIGAGLSLRKLGNLSGIPATTIEGYEGGSSIPAEKLVRIADALNYRDFVVDRYRFTVGRIDSEVPKPATREQLSLDFSAEYDYSRATVRIRPGSITVAFDATRLSVVQSTP